MDPITLEILKPVLIVFISIMGPAAFVLINRYFTLRHKEVELEAGYHGKFSEEQKKKLEARVASLEAGMGHLLQLLPRAEQPHAPAPQLQQPVAQSPVQQAGAMRGVAEGPPDAQGSRQAGTKFRER